MLPWEKKGKRETKGEWRKIKRMGIQCTGREEMNVLVGGFKLWSMLSLNGSIEKDLADEWWDSNIVSESKAIHTPFSRKSRLTYMVAQGKHCRMEKKKCEANRIFGFFFFSPEIHYLQSWLPAATEWYGFYLMSLCVCVCVYSDLCENPLWFSESEDISKDWWRVKT